MASVLATIESPWFYLWKYLKTLVYAAPVDSEHALHHRSVDIYHTIRNYPVILERMRRSMMRHVEVCIESYWIHFEHLLQMCSFSYNFQMFPDTCWYGHFSCFSMWNSEPRFNCIFDLHSIFAKLCFQYKLKKEKYMLHSKLQLLNTSDLIDINKIQHIWWWVHNHRGKYLPWNRNKTK
jgi:hypothetical protein